MLDETTIELNLELAQVVLLMLKAGIRRQCGGQRLSRHEARQKRTLARLGRRMKDELVAEGKSAEQAHLEASEKAAVVGWLRGIEYDSSTIEREMDNAS
jgi:hypothetical protein